MRVTLTSFIAMATSAYTSISLALVVAARAKQGGRSAGNDAASSRTCAAIPGATVVSCRCSVRGLATFGSSAKDA